MVSCSGSLVQSCCGEGGALQTNVTDLCGEPSQCSGHTGFAPLRGVCAFPSTLLRLPAALYGAGPALSAVPVFRSSTKARVRLLLRLCLPRPSSSGRQGLDGRPLPGAVRLLPSAVPASASARASRVRAACVCSRELASSRDPPGGCRPSRISGSLWLEAGSLFAVW